MNTILGRFICAGVLMGALAACSDGAKQFRLVLEQTAPAEQKAGEMLYDPLDLATCGEILKSRTFYDRYLRVQLNRQDYNGAWEDFWRITEVVPDAEGGALVVAFHLRGTETNPQGFAEALKAALNEYYVAKSAPGQRSPLLVRAVERVR